MVKCVEVCVCVREGATERERSQVLLHFLIDLSDEIWGVLISGSGNSTQVSHLDGLDSATWPVLCWFLSFASPGSWSEAFS